MDPFLEKIVLAVIALVLGLIAEPVRKIIIKERKRLTYSMSKKQIIGIDDSLPDALRSQIPPDWTGTLIQLHLHAENSGAQVLNDINLLCVAGSSSEIIHFAYGTTPPREVPIGEIMSIKNELRIPNITLEKNQSIYVDLFIRSPTQPDINIFWSGGGGGVDWRLATKDEAFGIERNIIIAIKYFVYAQVAQPLLSIIMYTLSSLASSLFSEGTGGIQWVVAGGATLGQLLGSIIQLYFYIRIVPHALVVAKEFMAPHFSVDRGRVTGMNIVGRNVTVVQRPEDDQSPR